MAKLGRREWLISTLGAVTACQGRRDPYAKPAGDSHAKSSMLASTSKVRTLCGACPAACGIEVRVCGGRAIAIEGNSKADFNKGRICPLGLAGVEGLYHPERVTGPMRRIGPRGQSIFQPISWEEALAWLIERLAKLRAAAAPERLVLLEGLGSFTTSLLWSRFLKAFGSPNHFALGPLHNMALLPVGKEVIGGGASLSVEALSRATYVLAVGESSLEAGVAWIPLVASQAQPHRPILGCVSSRLPFTGPTPDTFFSIHPGSAGLFLLSLVQVLVRLWGATPPPIPPEILERFAPDQVAGRVGLSAGMIEGLAKRLSKEKSVVVLPDETQDDPTIAWASVWLRQCLGTRTEAQNLVGPSFPSWPEVEIDAVARKGFSVHRLDGQDDGFKSWEGVRKIIQALVSVNEYKPSIILISGEGVEVEERALLTAEMVVSFSSYLTQSSPYCDLLLPNHHYLEAWDIEPVGRDARRLGQRRPVVQPTHHSRATGDVIVGLAKGLGSPLSETLPWKSHEAAVRSLFSQEIISGLETTGSWSVVPDEASYPSQGSSGSLPKLAWNFINTEVPSPDTSFPFLLVPAWGWGDIFPNLQWVREIPLVSGNPYVPRLEIHPTDAHRLGIRHGESVQLETPHFNVVANAFFRGGLRPGVLAMNRRPMRFSVCQARVRPNL